MLSTWTCNKENVKSQNYIFVSVFFAEIIQNTSQLQEISQHLCRDAILIR